MARGAGNKRKRAVVETQLIGISPSFSDLDSFRRCLRQLYEDQILCDVTFNVRGESFPCHKIVLAASNTFLSKLLLSGMSESSQSIIHLDNDPELFRFILNYIYGFHLEVPSSSIINLLGLASSYCMDGLRDKLAEILKENLSIENCCAIFAAADAYDCTSLKENAEILLYNNFAVAAKTKAFLDICPSLLKSILEADDILDCDEALVFEAVARWIEVNSAERMVNSQDLLQHVRFPLMNSCYLSDVIKHHPIMNGHHELLMEAFEHHALVAYGRDGICNIRTRKRRQSCSFTRSADLAGHSDAVSAILSLGEFMISGSWDSTIKVWLLDTWICVRTLSDHAGTIRGLCACGDKMVSCSDDGCIKVWSPGSWTCVRSMDGHDGAANVVLACRDRLASAGDDGTIKLWSTTTWMCEVTVHQAADDGANNDGASVGVISMQVCDDKLLSGGDDHLIRIWNTNNWTCEAILRGHHGEIYAIHVFGSDLLTGSVDGTLRVWRRPSLSRSSTTSAATVNAHFSSSSTGGSSSASAAATANGNNNNDDGNTISNASSIEWVSEHTVACEGPVYTICNLDNKVVTAGAGKKITIWKPSYDRDDDWKQHKTFETEEVDVWTMTVCKGRLVSGGNDGVVRVWI